MVDFMYYGEVNVSQEQLPAILKIAEMLKIKGLADMPQPGEKSELLTPQSSDWRRSSSPMSPAMRRKRLRKASTGSGSGSTGTIDYSLAPNKNDRTEISHYFLSRSHSHIGKAKYQKRYFIFERQKFLLLYCAECSSSIRYVFCLICDKISSNHHIMIRVVTTFYVTKKHKTC